LLRNEGEVFLMSFKLFLGLLVAPAEEAE